VDCFYSQTAQDLYHLHTHDEMGFEGRNLTDPIDLAVFTAYIRKADATNAALAKLCADTSGETLRHVGTATVVRDLEYLSRIIEGDDAPVNFWGFSYGTVVGSYFVNMYGVHIFIFIHADNFQVSEPRGPRDHRWSGGKTSDAPNLKCLTFMAGSRYMGELVLE
jgi:hypothetical protein